jgi:hypothetical protein
MKMKMGMEHWWNDIDRGKPKYWEKKPCPIITLSTTNPTHVGPVLNPKNNQKKQRQHERMHADKNERSASQRNEGLLLGLSVTQTRAFRVTNCGTAACLSWQTNKCTNFMN